MREEAAGERDATAETAQRRDGAGPWPRSPIDRESWYRHLVEHAPDIVYVFSEKHGGVFYSPRVEAVLGYSVDHLYAHPFLWNTLIHPDDQPRVMEAIHAFGRGRDFAIEYRIRTAGGDWVWLFDRSVSRIEADDDVLIEGLATDITARKDMEAALRTAQHESQTQQRRLSEVIWGTDAGTWHWNLETDENVLNERWAGILGRQLADLPTTIENWRQLTHPDDRARAEALLERCFRRELETYECEVRMRHASGAWVWVLTRGRVVEWAPDGRPLRMSGTHLDITSRKRAEEEREQLEAHLREAQRLEGLGRVAGSIAHDFNNVLMAILGNAEMAGAYLQEGSMKLAAECLDEIELAGGFARSLVQQILAYCRQQPPILVAQPLRKVVEEAVKIVRMAIPSHADLHVMLGGADLVAAVDAAQIGQVVLNLCTNAWQAIDGDGGSIAVSLDVCTECQGPCACLRVADSGCGMDEATRARLFEPFFTTRPMGQGTGLGMAVVRNVLRAHGGTIRVDSAPARGTVVEVHLPLSTAIEPVPTAHGHR